MSEKVLTIDDSKAYKFNLPENSTFDKYYKIQKEFDKIRKEHIKALLDWYEKQDKNRIRLWQKKM